MIWIGKDINGSDFMYKIEEMSPSHILNLLSIIVKRKLTSRTIIFIVEGSDNIIEEDCMYEDQIKLFLERFKKEYGITFFKYLNLGINYLDDEKIKKLIMMEEDYELYGRWKL